ncbi:hypothetical protein [Aureispira anguillae]|uniref:Uncharacterized protein n=1 Tax=Aureispira anguillae TaxID=2864201 RepID=A0A915YH39_9BACT|nr:hypothetical protein [Aureispira anguillae]BDS12871.1 hypothetical protein AsAng_0035960 [Aureispira anguillae]
MFEEIEKLEKKLETLGQYANDKAQKKIAAAKQDLAKLKAKGKNVAADLKETISGKEAATLVSTIAKANKTSKQLVGVIQSLVKIKKNIDTFAEQLVVEGLDTEDNKTKYNRYLKMSKLIASFLTELGKLKTNLDKLAQLKDSQLTAGISKTADYLTKLNKLLRAVLYLADDSTVKNFANNPESYAAAKAWAKHSADGFNMIGDIIESIPVPNGPMKDIIKYFSGVAKTGPKLIDAFIGAVDIKIKKIEESSGIKLFHSTKHYFHEEIIDPKDGKKKRLFEGAFIGLFAQRTTISSENESLKDLMQKHRDVLTDFSKTAAFRIDFLKKLILKKKANPNHPEDVEIYDEWLNTINEEKDNILKLEQGESEFRLL